MEEEGRCRDGRGTDSPGRLQNVISGGGEGITGMQPEKIKENFKAP
jgi:hypothetical protein